MKTLPVQTLKAARVSFITTPLIIMFGRQRCKVTVEGLADRRYLKAGLLLAQHVDWVAGRGPQRRADRQRGSRHEGVLFPACPESTRLLRGWLDLKPHD